MNDQSKTDHNCKSTGDKSTHWKKNLLKGVLKTASTIYSCYRLISKVLEFAKDFLV